MCFEDCSIVIVIRSKTNEHSYFIRIREVGQQVLKRKGQEELENKVMALGALIQLDFGFIRLLAFTYFGYFATSYANVSKFTFRDLILMFI